MALSKFFYVPNLIGYTRIAFMFWAFYVRNTSPYQFYFFYFMSQFLDMFDGIAARALGQSTGFGAMLDMVTDRCSDLGLMMVLASRYPEYAGTCHFFIWLDICSHWGHMLSQLKLGAGSHKNVSKGPALLQFYYRCHEFMVLLIMGAEGLPLCLYMLSFKETIPPIVYTVSKYLAYIALPFFSLKHIINVIQFFTAAVNLDPPVEKKE